MKTIALVACLALIGAGCASEETTRQEVATGTPSASTPAPAPADPAVLVPAPATEIQLAGMLGCGHCTFEVAEKCGPAVQTEDGVVHVLEGLDPGSDLIAQEHDEKEIQVVGTPREENGDHYLDVSSYEM